VLLPCVRGLLPCDRTCVWSVTGVVRVWSVTVCVCLAMCVVVFRVVSVWLFVSFFNMESSFVLVFIILSLG